jgi:twitching motility protein PilT
MEITELLRLSQKSGASDLHLAVDAPPMLRIHGSLVPIEGTFPLSKGELHDMLYEILLDEQKRRFEENLEMDFSVELKGVGRFRANIFYENRGEGVAFRTIPEEIKPLKDLGLPPVLSSLARREKGLILVTGPTGMGKSTTMAAMIDQINSEESGHIITIEDPIEFVHQHKKCIVSQREVGAHTKSFANALRSALREDPDVILVGEMRDLETTELAIRAAETGHLVFSSLHTIGAAETVNRIIDMYPPESKDQIRIQFAEAILAVISQVLIPTQDGSGRVVATEIMVGVPAVNHNIRKGDTHLIPNIIQTGSRYGMHSMDQSLKSLVKQGKITKEQALRYVISPLQFDDDKGAPK